MTMGALGSRNRRKGIGTDEPQYERRQLCPNPRFVPVPEAARQTERQAGGGCKEAGKPTREAAVPVEVRAPDFRRTGNLSTGMASREPRFFFYLRLTFS